MSRIASVLFILILVNIVVAACDTNQAQKNQTAILQLTQLFPYQYEFDGEFGRSRIDYYFIPAEIRNDINFVKTIRQLVENKKDSDSSNYSYYSIYVYEKTDTLNDSFKSSAQELKSMYKENVLSYSRWNKNVLDVFYIVESRNVVYDVLENKAIVTEWEFE